MKILVTGAKGTLGGMLARDLVEKGHEVRAADFGEVNIPGATCIAENMSDPVVCAKLAEGCDLICHMGAYHGDHLQRHPFHDHNKTEVEFFDANVAGLFYMLRAAVENNVPRFVWASSVVVYEQGHGQIFGIYTLTKQLGEDCCRFFNREHDLSITALRYGTFVECDFLTRGFGMLGSTYHGNWIERDDVLGLTLAATEKENITLGFYDVQTPLPLTPEDQWNYVLGDADRKVEVLSNHWPQHRDLLAKYKHLLPVRINTVNMTRTLRDLDYKFQKDFGWFLDELQRRLEAGESLS